MRKILALSVLLASFAFSTAFAIDPIYTKRDNKAIRGYDTVAYFTEGMPVKGNPEFSTEYQGATWQFASAENLQTFLSDPEKYAPQYGGYCAYAVAKNSTASTQPEFWAIVDGKLYLNYSKGVQKRWDKDRAGYIQASEQNWQGILCKGGKNSDLAACQ